MFFHTNSVNRKLEILGQRVCLLGLQRGLSLTITAQNTPFTKILMIFKKQDVPHGKEEGMEYFAALAEKAGRPFLYQ